MTGAPLDSPAVSPPIAGENLLALAGLRLERRLGTSVRIPKTLRLLSTDSILARSRIYIARPAEQLAFAGRELHH